MEFKNLLAYVAAHQEETTKVATNVLREMFNILDVGPKSDNRMKAFQSSYVKEVKGNFLANRDSVNLQDDFNKLIKSYLNTIVIEQIEEEYIFTNPVRSEVNTNVRFLMGGASMDLYTWSDYGDYGLVLSTTSDDLKETKWQRKFKFQEEIDNKYNPKKEIIATIGIIGALIYHKSLFLKIAEQTSEKITAMEKILFEMEHEEAIQKAKDFATMDLLISKAIPPKTEVSKKIVITGASEDVEAVIETLTNIRDLSFKLKEEE